MPYTRPELLAAFREDHPELKSIGDNELFAAIAVDHPDLAKGISEVQAPPSVSRGNSNLGALLMGVDPNTFLDRIGGAVAAGTNYLFPGGDTRKASYAPPELNPQQQIGANTAALGGMVETAKPLLSALANRLPSTARAGANLDLIQEAAKNETPDMAKAWEEILKRRELESAGHGPLPAPMTKLAEALQPASFDLNGQRVTIDPARLQYPQTFKMASAAKDIANNRSDFMTGAARGNTYAFANALQNANRGAAGNVGMADLFDAAMKEYSQAKTLETAKQAIAHALLKHGAKAALTGAGIGAGYGLMRDIAR